MSAPKSRDRRIVASINACAGAADPQPGELARLRSETALLIAMQRSPERVTRILDGIRALGERAASAERERDDARAQRDRLAAALRAIRDLQPVPFELPRDWAQQVADCAQCQSYARHPVQRGICNEHRRPLWERDRHDAAARSALGSRAALLAAAALREAGL